MDELIARSAKLTFLLAAVIALALVAMRQFYWAGGFLLGALWLAINFLLTVNILRVALLKQDKARLLTILLIKFPVLYLAGFLILASRVFPVASILAGAPLILLVVGVNKLCPKLI